MERLHPTSMSALWAAWADALGFISELTNRAGLEHRLRSRQLDVPIAWRRRIGGRFGVDVELPAGCYSDDTQLRLCTARAIHNSGFDVEAFARVELTLWPTYAIGGGRATKAACTHLTKVSTPWFANFYNGWQDAGGNGVAMRIQPHVWAAAQPAEPGPHIVDVLLNGITTHGHPRALVGAVFHALALGFALREGSVATPEQWSKLLSMCAHSVELFDQSAQLGSVWKPHWEETTGQSLQSAWRQTVNELSDQLKVAEGAVLDLAAARTDVALEDAYETLIHALYLRDPACRGAGTNTAAAAMALALGLQGLPDRAARLATRALGTDTDTIATMAAAISGVVAEEPPPTEVVDNNYIVAEAVRLAHIASGQATSVFSYPDLLHWTPPKTQLDAVGLADDRIALAGLAWLNTDKHELITKDREGWQWATSDFGASFLVKRRLDLRALPDGNWPVRRPDRAGSQRHAVRTSLHTGQLEFSETGTVVAGTDSVAASRTDPSLVPAPTTREGAAKRSSVDVDQILAWLTHESFADAQVGYALRRIAESGSMEQMVAFTTALRAAMREPRRSRSDRRD